MNIEIIGGGTVFHVRNHLALCAPAYGTTARQLWQLCGITDSCRSGEMNNHLHLTKMATSGNDYYEPSSLETNEDISKLVDNLIANPKTKIIFFNPALVDFDASVLEDFPDVGECSTLSGKYETRLKTSEGSCKLWLTPAKKIISKIRKERKDIFLVAFKTTCGASQDEQFLVGLDLLKTNSCNLVLANDTKTRTNMVITPEQARYHVTQDRGVALKGLVEMALSRSKGTFTRSTVIPGESVDWKSGAIPSSLREVVNHCISEGAYKPFKGSTVGHFAFKFDSNVFITSKRRSDFNKLSQTGMVMCVSSDDNKVIAYGSKPSVGGQSQRIIFREHPEIDCIVHFHCPTKPGSKVSTRDQAPYECGSHECGKNTSDGLTDVGNGIKCVYLDNHGPNIVFNRKTDPKEVINFINDNFDLSKSTDQIDRLQKVVV